MQTKLRSAADLMREAKREAAEMLFDEFWRQGEIALLFGEAGVGNSLIAVQAANAIAGGRPFGGLRMPTKGRRVLYVDLVLSDAQFRYRYAHGPKRGRMTFSRNFLYERSPHGADVTQWIRETVEANSIDCVVINDLNALLRTSSQCRRKKKRTTRTSFATAMKQWSLMRMRMAALSRSCRMAAST